MSVCDRNMQWPNGRARCTNRHTQTQPPSAQHRLTLMEHFLSFPRESFVFLKIYCTYSRRKDLGWCLWTCCWCCCCCSCSSYCYWWCSDAVVFIFGSESYCWFSFSAPETTWLGMFKKRTDSPSLVFVCRKHGYIDETLNCEVEKLQGEGGGSRRPRRRLCMLFRLTSWNSRWETTRERQERDIRRNISRSFQNEFSGKE